MSGPVKLDLHPNTLKVLDVAQNGCGAVAEILRCATRDYSLGVPWEQLEAHMLTCGDCERWRVRDAV